MLFVQAILLPEAMHIVGKATTTDDLHFSQVMFRSICNFNFIVSNITRLGPGLALLLLLLNVSARLVVNDEIGVADAALIVDVTEGTNSVRGGFGDARAFSVSSAGRLFSLFDKRVRFPFSLTASLQLGEHFNRFFSFSMFGFQKCFTLLLGEDMLH